MSTRIKFKGINYKEEDDGDIFVGKFEAISTSWEESLEIKEYIEKKLANILKGQKTLE